jgi:ribosomal protein S18 acetylase RimI-like enzyme
MSEAFELRPTSLADAPLMLALHRAAAGAPGSGLAREPDEMALDHIQSAIAKASASGVALGAWAGEAMIGEIHASRMGPRQFAHNLLDLTVAVRPDWQGRGVGARLFEGLFVEAAKLLPKVERIELMVREGNLGAVRLYERLGFAIEGRFARRVRLKDGVVETDLAMTKFL